MNDNLDEFFETFLANDAKKAQEKEAKIAEEQKKYEAQRQAEKQARQKEELNESFIRAVQEDDIAKAKETLKNGADISYLDRGIDAHDSYRITHVKSVEMVDFLLSNMDLNNPNHKQVAEEMIERAIVNDEASVDKYIERAKTNDLSLDSMMKVVSFVHDPVEVSKKLVQVGAQWNKLNFDNMLSDYYNQKNGFYGGRDGDVWYEPQPERAAKTKKMLVEFVKAGYPLNPEDSKQSDFIRELAYEHAYEKFSAQDKKLVTDLQNDNIDEIRKALNGGKIPNGVEQYMEHVSNIKGAFFRYYKEVMHIRKLDAPRSTLADFEQQYLETASLRDAIKVARFKPAGIADAVADKFREKFIKTRANDRHSFNMELADMVKGMNPECQKAVVEKIVPEIASQIDENFKKCNIAGKREESQSKVAELLAFSVKLYDVTKEDTGKNILRTAMLKFRTTGSNEERRQKADLYKDALNHLWVLNEVKKDETIKAVSSVSYTPLSSLNRQLMKHGKEME